MATVFLTRTSWYEATVTLETLEEIMVDHGYEPRLTGESATEYLTRLQPSDTALAEVLSEADKRVKHDARTQLTEGLYPPVQTSH